MKHKKLLIISAVSLAIILVFFLSYGITFKSMEAMNANNEITRIIKDVSIARFEAVKVEGDGKASVEYQLYFKLPSKIKMEDIEKNLGFSLKFKGKALELLGTEATEIARDFKPQEDEGQYMIKFSINPIYQKPADVEALLKNTEIDIEAIIYNKTKAVKTVKVK